MVVVFLKNSIYPQIRFPVSPLNMEIKFYSGIYMSHGIPLIKLLEETKMLIKSTCLLDDTYDQINPLHSCSNNKSLYCSNHLIRRNRIYLSSSGKFASSVVPLNSCHWQGFKFRHDKCSPLSVAQLLLRDTV